MKTNFKVGDKVFHYGFGWGKIDFIDDEQNDYPIVVMFESGQEQSFTLDGKFEFIDINPTLSFTEYSVSNFSQERPFEFPEADEEVMVSDDSINWKLAKFIRFRAYDNDYLVQVGRMQESFGFIKRLR
jgi:hypothetical protein